MSPMTDPQVTTELVNCDACGAPQFIADLDFPEPDTEWNTQFGWLVARCPDCGADIKVGLDKLDFLQGDA